jgi:DNA sulfur modification protein DndD
MIFEELVLQDVGVFAGRHVLDLRPVEAERPLILIGGLNGSGKTTIFDALWLVLYGPRTPASRRVGLRYPEYLRRLINHNANPMQGGRIELTLRYDEQAQLKRLRVVRSFMAMGSRVFDDLKIYEQDNSEPSTTFDWTRHVETKMPLALMRLFFFDGADMQHWLKPNENSDLEQALEQALGLGLTKQLADDLSSLERRKREELGAKPDQPARQEFQALHEMISSLEEQYLQFGDEIAVVQAEMVRVEHQLELIDERYELAGGRFHEQQGLWQEQLAQVADELIACERDIGEFVNDHAPLLLLESRTDAVLARDAQELQQSQSVQFALLLEHRDAALLSFLKHQDEGKELLPRIAEFLAEHRPDLSPDASDDAYGQLSLQIGPQARRWLQHWRHEGARQQRSRLQQLLGRTEELMDERARLESLLLKTPLDEELRPILEKKRALNDELQGLTQKLQELEPQQHQVLALKNRMEVRFLERTRSRARKSMAIEDVYRILVCSGRVRASLDKFRRLLTRKRLDQLTELVEDSLLELMRKQRLGIRVAIDPASWALSIFDDNGRELAPDGLSTGERQLLGHAIQWGVTRACSRALPVVIDAPLAHLDSAHRRNLVEHYFPYAAAQVIMLSTDEEIDHQFCGLLQPFISRTYLLHYDEASRSSVLESGYFPAAMREEVP